MYDRVYQLNLLKNNFKSKFDGLNIKFAVPSECKEFFNLDDDFITLENLEKDRDNFMVCEELKHEPKKNLLEDYCLKNGISVEVNREKPYGSGSEIVVFTNSKNSNYNLTEIQMEKIRRIFGVTLTINPEDFLINPRGKFVVGCECWQIFYSAQKKLPTYIITNNEGLTLFEKMFPLQKKLNL